MLRKMALLIFLIFTIPLAQADSTCAKPDIAAVINQFAKEHSNVEWNSQTVQAIFEELKYDEIHNLKTDSPLVQWISLGWPGPPDGYIFALDCKAEILDGQETGTVSKLQPGPMVPGYGQTILVSYVDGRGTGETHSSISVVAVKDAKILWLWTHELSDTAFILPNHDGTETSYSISIASDGGLEVSGETRTYAPTDNDWSKTPKSVQKTKERYCWSSAKNSFAQ